MKKNPYEVLGVEVSATKAVISKAYKQLAKKYHPDVNKEAYSVIGDDAKRAEFDNPRQQNFSFDLDQFSTLFNQNRQRNFDINVPIKISLKDSIFGCKHNFKIPVKEKCDDCNWGVKSFDACKACNGTGQMNAKTQGNWMFSMPCQRCRGQGKSNLVMCKNCQEGYKTTGEEDLEIAIPIGVSSGIVLQVRGSGDFFQGNRGNLNIHISVDQHANVTRLNNDLIYRVWCPIPQMLYGGTINLAFFDLKFDVQIPEKTQSGSKIRLKNQGIQGGDLFLVVNADINSVVSLLEPPTNDKPEINYSNTL
jgi:molecular chaperone DnaJ